VSSNVLCEKTCPHMLWAHRERMNSPNSINNRQREAIDIAKNLGWQSLADSLEAIRFEHFDESILREAEGIAALWANEVAAGQAKNHSEAHRIAVALADAAKDAQKKVNVARCKRLKIALPSNQRE
jgi:hypothetical protein